MKLRCHTDAGVAKTRAFQPPRYFIAFAAGSFGVWEDEGGVLSALMCFSRKERKDRKGVGMGRRVSARPLAAPSGFARTLLRLCFAKLLASLVGGPDGFAAGASRAQATRRLPARANDAVHEQTRKSHATNWRRLQLVKISYKFISMAEATHVTFRLSFV